MRRIWCFLSAALVAAAMVFTAGCGAFSDGSSQPTQPTATQTSPKTTRATPTTAPELTSDNLAVLLAPLIAVVENGENGFCGLEVDPADNYRVTTPGCGTVLEAKAYLSQFLAPAMLEKYFTADALMEKDGALYCKPPEDDPDRWQLMYDVSGARLLDRQGEVYQVEIPLFRKQDGRFVSTDLLRVRYVNGYFQLVDIDYGSVAP